MGDNDFNVKFLPLIELRKNYIFLLIIKKKKQFFVEGIKNN